MLAEMIILAQVASVDPCRDEKMLSPGAARDAAEKACTEFLTDLYMRKFLSKFDRKPRYPADYEYFERAKRKGPPSHLDIKT